MSAQNREVVRDEIATGLETALTGEDKPVLAVYNHQPGKLDGASPVILVLSGPIQRRIQGIGTQRYYNTVDIEIHALVYDGKENQPLTEDAREDKLDKVEQLIADWFATHQVGENYRNVEYTPKPTEKRRVTYLDGNPYQLEVIPVRLNSED